MSRKKKHQKRSAVTGARQTHDPMTHPHFGRLCRKLLVEVFLEQSSVYHYERKKEREVSDRRNLFADRRCGHVTERQKATLRFLGLPSVTLSLFSDRDFPLERFSVRKRVVRMDQAG